MISFVPLASAILDAIIEHGEKLKKLSLTGFNINTTRFSALLQKLKSCVFFEICNFGYLDNPVIEHNHLKELCMRGPKSSLSTSRGIRWNCPTLKLIKLDTVQVKPPIDSNIWNGIEKNYIALSDKNNKY